MNVIERTRELLESFPKISEVCGEVHVDFTDPEPTSCGLSSIGDKLVSEDVLGNQQRQHSFLLYATYSSINDYERLSNSTALLELSQWLHSHTGGEVTSIIDDEECSGIITEIRAENGMLYSVPQENLLSGVQYQLQITVTYTALAEN
ncbi:MAG: hypothetical protein LIO40_00020 [Ruminococcus sp.]|nr:hypothetical protein [Ruminococcus sp.]